MKMVSMWEVKYKWQEKLFNSRRIERSKLRIKEWGAIRDVKATSELEAIVKRDLVHNKNVAIAI